MRVKSRRIASIQALSMKSSVQEVLDVVAEVFSAHFGITGDKHRLMDIQRQVLDFLRATAYRHRIAELGDVLCSLLAFVHEQDVDVVEAIKATLLKIERRGNIYARKSDVTNVAILGTAANPATIGHIAFGETVLNIPEGIDEVWFMPPGEYAGSKELIPAHHRAAMCRLLQKVNRRFRFCSFEMDKGLDGQTLNTMRRLLSDPQLTNRCRIHFAITTETAESLLNWPGAEELMQLVTFIVVQRPGYIPKLMDPWYTKRPHIFTPDAKGLIEVSSTDVRNAIAAGNLEQARSLVHPLIWDYMEEHRLYRATA